MSTNFIDINPEEWISQAEAARLRRVSRQAIMKLIKRGRLKILTIGGHTLVNKNDVLKFQKNIGGRPKKNVKK